MRTTYQDEWQTGWRVLFAATVGTGVTYGLFLMTAGLFIIPMQEAFGWSRSAISIGPIVGLASAFLAPLGGMLIDRHGPRSLAIAGLVLLGAIFLCLAVMPMNAAFLYGMVVLLAFAGTISSANVYCKGVATWFRRNSGLAFGITMSGNAVFGAAILPFLAMLIERHGWRSGYLALGAIVLLAGLPLVMAWFREKGETGTPGAPSPVRLDGVSFRQAVRDRRYWLCVVVFGGAGLPIGGFMGQLQPLLVSHAFTATAAAAAGSVFLVAIALGRLAAGALADRFSPPRVASFFFLLPAVGCLLLAVAAGGAPVWGLAAVAVFLLGLGQGAEVNFMAHFTLKLFGLRAFSTIFASFGLVVGATIGLGGILFALLYDVTGSYLPTIHMSIAFFLVSAVLVLLINIPRKPATGEVPARVTG